MIIKEMLMTIIKTINTMVTMMTMLYPMTMRIMGKIYKIMTINKIIIGVGTMMEM